MEEEQAWDGVGSCMCVHGCHLPWLYLPYTETTLQLILLKHDLGFYLDAVLPFKINPIIESLS